MEIKFNKSTFNKLNVDLCIFTFSFCTSSFSFSSLNSVSTSFLLVSAILRSVAVIFSL